MTSKSIVFLTEGPEGWDRPIADLAALCTEAGQRAMVIDLARPDASPTLAKAAGEGIECFVSLEGIGAQMTANNRSIFDVLHVPLLTFVLDHPCFYSPLLSTPQKLVVPLFLSAEHVLAARGIYGNVPLAPVVAPWGPCSTELIGEPVPAIHVDAGTFIVAKAVESQHPLVVDLVREIASESAAPEVDVYTAYTRLLEARWIPLAGIATVQRGRLCQWAAATARVDAVRALLADQGPCAAAGTGWPNGLEPRLAALTAGQRPLFEVSTPDAAIHAGDALRKARNLARRSGAGALPTTIVKDLLRAAESGLFVHLALAGVK